MTEHPCPLLTTPCAFGGVHFIFLRARSPRLEPDE